MCNMDFSDKLVELSDSLYVAIAQELKRNNISASAGRLVVESVYRRITDDALALTVSRNHALSETLANITKERDQLKAKLSATSSACADDAQDGGVSK